MPPATRSKTTTKTGRDPRQTPAMQQFARFKTQHPDCVLFFRMGDFYEMFDADAELAHRVLGITLTQRTEGIPMAGVPYHAVEGYLRRMIEAGYRVAVCEQVQDPKDAKGVVDRAVTRVLTPGTLVDETLLDESRPNIVAAVVVDGTAASIALMELSTGRFDVHESAANQVIDDIARLGPSELVFAESDDGDPPEVVERARTACDCALTPRPGWQFTTRDAVETLRDHFGVRTLAGFGLEDTGTSARAAGALLRYIRETQGFGDAVPLDHVRPPHRATTGDILQIDAASLRSLEIEQTMRSGRKEGSLLSIMQRARSPMGKRLLRRYLCLPLRDRARIEARQRIVRALVDDDDLTERLHESIRGIQDVARIVGRVSMRRATPRDVVAVGASCHRIDTLTSLLEGHPAFADEHTRLRDLGTRLGPLAADIQRRCVDTPPAHLRDGGLFVDDIDPELDECRHLQRDANDWLARYQAELAEASGIASLKVGYNRVFGYYIEVTNAHRDKAPVAWSRKQTLKNAERYITDELKTFETKVMTAQSRAIEREKTLFEELCTAIAALTNDLSVFADTIARIDALAAFAEVAITSAYVCPTLVEEPTLDIRAGRHPVLDATLAGRFVPNDCTLGTGPSLALITGPNMAGKSTYIRQVALIVLLAHTGSFVPAEAATIGMTDRIFTRIGASDELHAGQSTFMVEMTETANIMHNATERSLVILDEIGRGTSTLDGLSLAWAITEALGERGCRTLFATHYHELTALADRIERIVNLHVEVREWGEEIAFLHRILPGRTDRSYGIHVARIAGLPDDVIARATTLLETLSVDTQHASAESLPPPTSPQLDLFTTYVEHPLIAKVRELKLEAMSPLDAFDLLRELREDAE